MARLRMIISSIWNAFLGRQEDKYYGEILDRSFEQMTAKVTEVKQGLAKVAESKHRILGLITENRGESARYGSVAVKFVEAGQEDKARAALDQQAYLDQVLIDLQLDLDAVEQQRLELSTTLQELDRSMSRFSAQKEALKGRHAAAKASADILETMTGINSDAMDAGQTVARMTERMKANEARAAGVKELVAEGTFSNIFTPGQTALDRSAAAIERKSAVDDKLSQIKKQLEPARQ